MSTWLKSGDFGRARAGFTASTLVKSVLNSSSKVWIVGYDFVCFMCLSFMA